MWHTSDRTGSPGLAEVPTLNSSETQKGFSKVSSREDGECVGCVVLRRIKCGVWGEGCGVHGDQRQSHHTREEEKA